MNIIRSVIEKAFVWRNRCSSTRKRCKTFGCFRVAILGSFMAGFLLLFNCCRVRCSSLMNLSGLPCHISWKYLKSFEFQNKDSKPWHRQKFRIDMLSERRHWEKIENRKKIVLEVYIRVRLLRINSISIFVKLSESAFIRTLQVLSVSVLR